MKVIGKGLCAFRWKPRITCEHVYEQGNYGLILSSITQKKRYNFNCYNFNVSTVITLKVQSYVGESGKIPCIHVQYSDGWEDTKE